MLHICFFREIKAFMRAWRLTTVLKSHLQISLTFGPRGILRLPMRNGFIILATCVSKPCGCFAINKLEVLLASRSRWSLDDVDGKEAWQC